MIEPDSILLRFPHSEAGYACYLSSDKNNLSPFSYTEYIALLNLCIFRVYAIARHSVLSVTDSHLSTNLC